MEKTIEYHEIIDCLVEVMEAKDAYTKGHSSRVADFACDIAKSMGFNEEQVEIVHIASHLHDVGKVGIPDNILNKNGTLSMEEWGIIRTHPTIGYNILKKSKTLKEIAIIVLHHHERFDGEGYPLRLKGNEIPLASRILTVSDSIDAITSKRPYRDKKSWGECKKEIIKNKGKQFDPDIVDNINDLWEKWSRTK